MEKNKIKAIIFDLDGLMLDTEPVAMRAMAQAIREKNGWEMTFAFFRQLIGHARSDTYGYFEAEYGFTKEETNAVRDRTAALIVEAIGRGEGRPKKGLNELLDLLDEKAVPRVVASSSPRSQILQKLRMVGLLHRINSLVSGWEVSQSKPAPDIFLKAAELIAAPPENCLVLEDSPAGLLAAKRAGMAAIMVPDLVAPGKEEEELALAVLPDLCAVRERLSDML